jgi:hypothetical protein
MSSFVRRMQRQVLPSQAVHATFKDGKFHANPPRQKFFNGRGSKLGVSNPKDKALLARLARDRKWGRKS